MKKPLPWEAYAEMDEQNNNVARSISEKSPFPNMFLIAF